MPQLVDLENVTLEVLWKNRNALGLNGQDLAEFRKKAAHYSRFKFPEVYYTSRADAFEML